MNRSMPTLFLRLLAACMTMLLVVAACGNDDADSGADTPDPDAASDQGENGDEPEPGAAEHDYSDLIPFHMSSVFPGASIGQIEAVLTRTNIPELWGLDLESTRFASAVEMVNALAADAIDMFWASDLPVTSAIGRGLDLTIVASSIGWRYGIATLEDSGIQDLEDMRGRSLGVHIGNSTQIYIQELLEEAGLEPGVDVEIINVPTPEMNTALQSGVVDAVGTWDPGLRLLEGARELASGQTGAGTPRPAGTLAVQQSLIDENSEVIVRFLAAMIEATWFAIENPDLTNGWFGDESGLPIDVLEQMLETEPLWQASDITGIDMRVTDDATGGLTRNVAYFAAEGLAPAAVDVSEHVDNSLVEEAMERVSTVGGREIEVVQP